jgi:Mrp family chromosome partitioning ATPase/O-antigen/teichoic acid export membrane protein
MSSRFVRLLRIEWLEAMLGKLRAGASWRLPRRASLRLGWGVADQAMSSLTNFAVAIYVARALGATQFGAFSLAYVTYSFVLTGSRGLATDPLMVRFSGTDLPTWRRAVAGCTGTAAVLGLATGACVLTAAAMLHGTAGRAFLALGLTLPGLLLQDSWRYSFFALGRGSQAFVNDTIWASIQFPALVVLRITGHADIFWCVFAWGAAAAAGAAAGTLQARVIPKPSAARAWVSRHRDLGLRYLAENTSNSGAAQLRTYGVGLISGLAAVGYVQAAYTLMGPFLVLFMGMSLVTVPEAARVLRRSPRHLPPFCVLVGAALALAGLTWGIVLLVALPRGLGVRVLGSIWRPTYPLILPATISVMGACVSAGAAAGLHALAAARRSLRAMVLTSAAFLGFGLAGAVTGGAFGTMLGAAVATWIGALLWWWQLHLALQESGHFPDGYLAARRRRTLQGPAPPVGTHPASPANPGHTKPQPLRPHKGESMATAFTPRISPAQLPHFPFQLGNRPRGEVPPGEGAGRIMATPSAFLCTGSLSLAKPMWREPSKEEAMKTGGADSPGFEPTVFSAVRRYWTMVLAVALAGMVAAIGYTLMQPKAYVATGSVTVPPTTLQGQDTGQYLDSQVLLMNSQDVARRAADIANRALHSDRLDVGNFYGSGSSLVIIPPASGNPGVYGVSIIQVKFTGPSAQTAQAGANAVLQAFNDVRNATITAGANATIAGIDRTIDVTKNQSRQAALWTERSQALVNEQTDLAHSPTVLWAVEPTKNSQGWKRAGLVGLVIGIVVGAALAYVRANMRRGFADRQDPAALYGVPLIGEIPAFAAKKTSRSNGAAAAGRLPIAADPHSAAAEAFRFAAGSVERVRAVRSPRLSLAVVSPLSGGGKSTVVANLALAIAEGGTRVLAVDADTADSGLTARLLPGIPADVGLEQVLAGQQPLADCIQPSPLNGAVAVLGPGLPPQRRVTGAARAKAASALLAKAKSSFDVVLIDSPALLQVADATELVDASDAAVIVLSPNELIRDHLEMVDRLKLIGSDVVGYIYNRAPMRPHLAHSYWRDGNGSSASPAGLLAAPPLQASVDYQPVDGKSHPSPQPSNG